MIDCINHIDDILSDILQLFLVIPDTVKQLQELPTKGAFKTRHHIADILATLTPKLNRRKGIHGQVYIAVFWIIYYEKVVHSFSCHICTESSFPLHPLCALLRHSLLLELISKTNFKFRTI